MSDDFWGPWIEHDGKGCPISIGEYFQLSCLFSDGHAKSGRGFMTDKFKAALIWRMPEGVVSLHYRIRKPRGLTILEEIARGVKEPQEVGV